MDARHDILIDLFVIGRQLKQGIAKDMCASLLLERGSGQIWRDEASLCTILILYLAMDTSTAHAESIPTLSVVVCQIWLELLLGV